MIFVILSEIQVLPVLAAILLSVVFEITVFEIAMVDCLGFAVKEKQI